MHMPELESKNRLPSAREIYVGRFWLARMMEFLFRNSELRFDGLSPRGAFGRCFCREGLDNAIESNAAASDQQRFLRPVCRWRLVIPRLPEEDICDDVASHPQHHNPDRDHQRSAG